MHACVPIHQRSRASPECLHQDKQLLDGLPLCRTGRRLDLNAEHVPRHVGVKVSRGRAAAGTNVWEEAQGVEVLEDIRDGEGKAADDPRQ